MEIIDFSEDSEEGNDQVTVFAENGKKRIIEALQTVMWTELCDPDTQEGENLVQKIYIHSVEITEINSHTYLTKIS